MDSTVFDIHGDASAYITPVPTSKYITQNCGVALDVDSRCGVCRVSAAAYGTGITATVDITHNTTFIVCAGDSEINGPAYGAKVVERYLSVVIVSGITVNCHIVCSGMSCRECLSAQRCLIGPGICGACTAGLRGYDTCVDINGRNVLVLVVDGHIRNGGRVACSECGTKYMGIGQCGSYITVHTAQITGAIEIGKYRTSVQVVGDGACVGGRELGRIVISTEYSLSGGRTCRLPYNLHIIVGLITIILVNILAYCIIVDFSLV